MRVLIVDDEFLIALQLRQELQALGHEVVGVARNGRRAVELCGSLLPDLVLMDVQMPELDGLAATRELMTKHPVCVVIVTGEAHSAQAAEEAGAMACAGKPLTGVSIPELFETARGRFDRFVASRGITLRRQQALAALPRYSSRVTAARRGCPKPT